jgi:hypothetical protein
LVQIFVALEGPRGCTLERNNRKKLYLGILQVLPHYFLCEDDLHIVMIALALELLKFPLAVTLAKVQMGTFREHSGNIQGTFGAYSVNIQ